MDNTNPQHVVSPQRPARRKGKISKDDILKSAAIMGDTTMFLKLLKEEENFVNYQDTEGNTPLHHCAEHGQISLVQLLIEKKGNVNIKNKSLSTPLHIASVNGHQEVVSFLLKNNATIDIADIGGLTGNFYIIKTKI